jgi:hypothetical protein
MFELTTPNVFTAADNGLISFAAEPVEKPDARFICVGLGIVIRHGKVNAEVRDQSQRSGRRTGHSGKQTAGSTPALARSLFVIDYC